MPYKLFLHRVLSFVLAAIVLLSLSGSAFAGWVLYDDFSDSDWSDKWAYGSEGANSDVSWTQVDGVLRVQKTVGSTDINSDNGNRCRLYPYNAPATSNGFRYDVRVVSASGSNVTDGFAFRGWLSTDGVPIDFGSGDEDVERVTVVDVKGYDLTTSPGVFLTQRAWYESKVNYETNYNDLHTSSAWIESGGPLGVWTVVSLLQGTQAGYIDLDIDNATNQRHYSRVKLSYVTSGDLNPFGYLRVNRASATAAFVVEVDNVYYHTGEFVPGIESEGKGAVVIPLF